MKDIIVKNLNKRFGEKTALKDFSADFECNKVTALMGESGCGKTTLLRILMGLIPSDSGEILNIPERMAVVFQEDRLCESFSVIENVLLVSDENRKEAAKELIAKLGLSGEEDNIVSELSGGMKRRVAIARALLYESDVLILDEPFKGLDEMTRSQAASVIKEYANTIIMVTHDVKEAELMEAKIIHMQKYIGSRT